MVSAFEIASISLPELVETVQALARLLLQLKSSPALSRDFALIAYPVVNVRGFTAAAAPLADFEARFARDSAEADVQFFKIELNKWRFDGLLSLRVDSSARGFYAAVRSEIIAAEVVVVFQRNTPYACIK